MMGSTSLSNKYPEVETKWAVGNSDAVAYISRISDAASTISTNNPSIVNQELASKLAAAGFTVINSYHHEFDIKEKEIKDYWDLPRLSDRNLTGSFGIVCQNEWPSRHGEQEIPGSPWGKRHICRGWHNVLPGAFF
jgi:hypothetical protein